jgi:hypothetical protein
MTAKLLSERGSWPRCNEKVEPLIAKLKKLGRDPSSSAPISTTSKYCKVAQSLDCGINGRAQPEPNTCAAFVQRCPKV